MSLLVNSFFDRLGFKTFWYHNYSIYYQNNYVSVNFLNFILALIPYYIKIRLRHVRRVIVNFKILKKVFIFYKIRLNSFFFYKFLLFKGRLINDFYPTMLVAMDGLYANILGLNNSILDLTFSYSEVELKLFLMSKFRYFFKYLLKERRRHFYKRVFVFDKTRIFASLKKNKNVTYTHFSKVFKKRPYLIYGTGLGRTIFQKINIKFYKSRQFLNLFFSRRYKKICTTTVVSGRSTLVKKKKLKRFFKKINQLSGFKQVLNLSFLKRCAYCISKKRLIKYKKLKKRKRFKNISKYVKRLLICNTFKLIKKKNIKTRKSKFVLSFFRIFKQFNKTRALLKKKKLLRLKLAVLKFWGIHKKLRRILIKKSFFLRKKIRFYKLFKKFGKNFTVIMFLGCVLQFTLNRFRSLKKKCQKFYKLKFKKTIRRHLKKTRIKVIVKKRFLKKNVSYLKRKRRIHHQFNKKKKYILSNKAQRRVYWKKRQYSQRRQKGGRLRLLRFKNFFFFKIVGFFFNKLKALNQKVFFFKYYFKTYIKSIKKTIVRLKKKKLNAFFLMFSLLFSKYKKLKLKKLKKNKFQFIKDLTFFSIKHNYKSTIKRRRLILTNNRFLFSYLFLNQKKLLNKLKKLKTVWVSGGLKETRRHIFSVKKNFIFYYLEVLKFLKRSICFKFKKKSSFKKLFLLSKKNKIKYNKDYLINIKFLKLIQLGFNFFFIKILINLNCNKFIKIFYLTFYKKLGDFIKILKKTNKKNIKKLQKRIFKKLKNLLYFFYKNFILNKIKINYYLLHSQFGQYFFFFLFNFNFFTNFFLKKKSTFCNNNYKRSLALLIKRVKVKTNYFIFLSNKCFFFSNFYFLTIFKNPFYYLRKRCRV